MERAEQLRAYALMLESRAVDDYCKKLLADGEAVPNYHSGTGQEGLSVGVGLAAQVRDYLLFTYRDFGMLLAKGVTLTELAGDLLLRKAGTTGGHGGIMHVSSPENNVVGRNSVFGSRFGIAIGLGKAAKIRAQGAAVLCPFGEAEGGRGVLYESLNMASLDNLPVVFVAENNGYSISSRTSDLFAAGTMTGMFRGGPVPNAVVDGNDVAAVHAATSAALDYCRAGLGPYLLEFMTYRIDPHIPADDHARYRTLEEIDQWRVKDPIENLERLLIGEGMSPADLAQAGNEARANVSNAFEAALASPPPDIDSMYHHLYYNEGPFAAPSGGLHA
jgi:pyruvate dehydrogenase E1 component alpha subunit